MLLSVTEAAKVAGCARSTIYDKINSGELSRSPGGKIDTAELHRVFGELQTPSLQQPDVEPDKSDTMASELLDMVQAKDTELSEVRKELDDTRRRLAEHREAARSLMSPEDFEAKLAEQATQLKSQHTKELDTERQLHAKHLAKQKQQRAREAEQWQQAIAERKQEIQQARAEAADIRQREQEQVAALRREQARIKALESRGLIARLLNKKPEPVG